MVVRLIVTNGDNTTAGMMQAGFDAELLPWRDVLHDGPVPAGLTLEELSKLRAKFLAGEFGAPAKVGSDFAERDAKIRSHLDCDRVELWFEHDLYDQLQLIQLLDFFAQERRSEGLFLVQADDYLGLQTPEALAALQPNARPVRSDQFALAQSAWAAFTGPTPEKIPPFAFDDHASLPYLASALRRLLLELPAVASGVSLTEERCLAALRDSPRSVGALFKITQEQEQARFLADLPFFKLLDGLGFGATPLLGGLPCRSKACVTGSDEGNYRAFAKAELTLTDAGRAALDGRFDHAQENGIARWFGGTLLKAGSIWRRDQRGQLVSPSAMN
jgi:hypothetical protein